MNLFEQRKPFYKSKKVWASFIAFFIAMINQIAGLDMDYQEVVVIVLPLIAYVFGEAWTDAAHKSEGGE